MNKPSELFDTDLLISDSLDIDTAKLDMYDFLSDEIVSKFDRVLDDEKMSNEDAVEAFLNIAQQYSENSYVALCAAENIAAYGGEELALQLMETIVTNYPDNIMAGFSLSRMLLFADDCEDAQDVFKDYAEKIMQEGRHVYAAHVIELIYVHGLLCAAKDNVQGCKHAISMLEECCPGHHYIEDLTEMIDDI